VNEPGTGQWLAEFVATFGLVVTILGCVARTPAAVPHAVGLYITSAYWFTASTSSANPAVTIARSLSDTFAGIAPAGGAPFIAHNSSVCFPRSFLTAGFGETQDSQRAVNLLHARRSPFLLTDGLNLIRRSC
jgi:hypothetical protein